MTPNLDDVLLPKRFASRGPDEAGWVPIVVRADVDDVEVAPILASIADVDWSSLCHAYGSAEDVGPQLAAIAVGDWDARRTAWWNLWGNIHHQGTIYAATVPAIPILVRLAEWPSYPDRAQAIFFLREVAEAAGVVVWGYDSEGRIVHDEKLQNELTSQLKGTVDRAAEQLIAPWRTSPLDIRRALILLLTSLPDRQAEYHELVDEDLPDDLRAAWDQVASGHRVMTDEIDEFERWAHTGE